jgi:hypothetical protein
VQGWGTLPLEIVAIIFDAVLVDTAHGNDMMKSRTTLRKMAAIFDRLAQVLSVRAAVQMFGSARLQGPSPHVLQFLPEGTHNRLRAPFELVWGQRQRSTFQAIHWPYLVSSGSDWP